MQTSILTIPFDPEREFFEDDGFRKFLINKKVTTLRPEFFQQGGKAYWTVFVEYEPVLDDEGPQEKTLLLNKAQRVLFDQLRVWRREKADKEGIPVFIIATNGQLAEVARKAPKTFEALREIKGFGKKKLERHGKEIVDLVTAFYAKASRHEHADKEPRREG